MEPKKVSDYILHIRYRLYKSEMNAPTVTKMCDAMIPLVEGERFTLAGWRGKAMFRLRKLVIKDGTLLSLLWDTPSAKKISLCPGDAYRDSFRQEDRQGVSEYEITAQLLPQ